MIAASVKDGDAIVDVLLQRGADVNQKSTFLLASFTLSIQDDLTNSIYIDQNGQVCPSSNARV
ncbi:hypothetical protein F5Y10DRAFT_175 [Nemania abortiva]|nr:hypothetical protein F5Y10DRAFT_175 [Nemania abortiva]